MANYKSAFATVTGPEQDAGSFIRANEQLDAARRAEDREIDEILRKRKEDEELKKEKTLAEIKFTPLSDTGVKTIDDFNYVHGNLVIEEIGDIKEQLDNLPLSDPSRAKLQKKYNTLQSSYSILPLIEKSYTNKAKDYIEGLIPGDKGKPKYRPNTVLNNIYSSGLDNVSVGIDDNGRFVYKNKDGSVINYNEATGILEGLPEPLRYIDYGEEIQKSATELGTTKTYDPNKGDYIITTKQVNDSSIKAEAEKLLGSTDNPTDFAKNAYIELGLDATNPKDRDVLKERVIKDIKIRTDFEKTRTADPTRLDDVARSRGRQEEKKVTIGDLEQYATVTYEGTDKDDFRRKQGLEGARDYAFQGDNLTVKFTGGAEGTITNIYYNPKDQNVVFYGKLDTGKKRTRKEGPAEDSTTTTEPIIEEIVLSTKDGDLREMSQFIKNIWNPKTEKYFGTNDFLDMISGGEYSKNKQKGESGSGSSKPKQITQGGFTYTWNEKTQQYE